MNTMATQPRTQRLTAMLCSYREVGARQQPQLSGFKVNNPANEGTLHMPGIMERADQSFEDMATELNNEERGELALGNKFRGRATLA